MWGWWGRGIARRDDREACEWERHDGEVVGAWWEREACGVGKWEEERQVVGEGGRCPGEQQQSEREQVGTG